MELELFKKIPEWSLESIFQESPPSVDAFLNSPLLILIFSLDCPGCLGRAIPYANRMIVEKGNDLNVIGIHTNTDQCEYTPSDFQTAKVDLHIRFPLYKDHKNQTYLKYGAGGTPHWILTDENGLVQYSIFGSNPNNALMRLDYKIQEIIQ
jgi:peroxiredoxin